MTELLPDLSSPLGTPAVNVNMRDAKTNLSKLIQRALNGEDIVLAQNGAIGACKQR